jgi:hypothetical protein
MHPAPTGHACVTRAEQRPNCYHFKMEAEALERTRSRLATLWAGEVPLGEVFWTYAVAGGLVVNAVGTILCLWALSTGASLLFIYLPMALPIPYNIFMLVAVWRSAARYNGPRERADLARAAILLWTTVECLI